MSQRFPTLPRNPAPAAPRAYIPPMNPLMARRLPEIVEELLAVQAAIEEPVKRAAAAVAELQDYLRFEAQKNELAMGVAGAPCDMRRQFSERLGSTEAILQPEDPGRLITLLNELTDDLSVHYLAPMREMAEARA